MTWKLVDREQMQTGVMKAVSCGGEFFLPLITFVIPNEMRDLPAYYGVGVGFTRPNLTASNCSARMTLGWQISPCGRNDKVTG